MYGCRLFFFIKKGVLGFEKRVLGFEKRVLGFFSGVTKNVTWQSPRGKVEIGDLKEIKILFIHLDERVGSSLRV